MHIFFLFYQNKFILKFNFLINLEEIIWTIIYISLIIINIKNAITTKIKIFNYFLAVSKNFVEKDSFFKSI